MSARPMWMRYATESARRRSGRDELLQFVLEHAPQHLLGQERGLFTDQHAQLLHLDRIARAHRAEKTCVLRERARQAARVRRKIDAVVMGRRCEAARELLVRELVRDLDLHRTPL